MRFWIIVLKSSSQNWAVPLSAPQHLEFLHVRILRLKVVAGKVFPSLSLTDSRKYVPLFVFLVMDVHDMSIDSKILI